MLSSLSALPLTGRQITTKQRRLRMKELENPADYFPYIAHDLDPNYIAGSSYYINLLGDIIGHVTQVDPDTITLNGMTGNSVFRSVKVKGAAEQRRLAADNSAVELLLPRHRSLYDYCIGQPVHNRLLNPNVIIIAGNNLFVSKFDWFLRKYGAFMFLREDVVLKKKNYPKVFLTQKRYLDEIFPAYMKQQMFEGHGPEKQKMDVLVYAEQEKDPVTKKRNGGRTKTGRLRNLSHIIFDKLKGLTRESGTKLYVTPMNISFSKYPEAPYIVHPSKSKGLMKGIRYMIEQYFTFVGYTKYSHVHHEARLEVTVHYGKPEILHADNFSSMSDLLRYSARLKEKIGLLEAIYPLALLYRAMDEDTDISFAELTERAKKLFARYRELAIDVENISDAQGNLLPIEELANRSVLTMNSNPDFFISGFHGRKILTIENGRLISHDPKLQKWYGNMLRHLDHDCIAPD
jgi:hypothetical protein